MSFMLPGKQHDYPLKIVVTKVPANLLKTFKECTDDK